MIRKCEDSDLNKLIAYLYESKEMNLFLIGDIEVFGLDNENINIYIDIDLEIKAVYLRFFTSLSIVSYGKVIDQDFMNQLIDKFSIDNINGEKSVIDKIEVNSFKQRDYYFATLNKLNIEIEVDEVILLDKTKLKDYLSLIDSIFNNKSNYDSTKAELDNGSKHIFTIIKNDEIVSGASSSAESSELAMIIGVATREKYRRKGYALKCVYALCNKLINQGKTVCLFYDNPNAAKMYKKIGFKDIGYYSMLKKNKNK
ncbi:MAG: GNAT family N-acetyltransferase [Pleomorphochaeta sp.]